MTTIGKIQKTFGAHGELLLALYGDFSLPQDTPLFISIDGLNVPFYLKSAEEKGNKLVVVFDDMESEKRALELVGKEVAVELSARQSRIMRDEHTAQSNETSNLLIGYKVTDKTSGELGTITNRLDYPGNPCLQVTNAAGQEIIIPANNDLVVSVDNEQKILTMDLPQGLLEIYLSEE